MAGQSLAISEEKVLYYKNSMYILKEEYTMQISKDMLIGALIQMDDCIATDFNARRHALSWLPGFSGRVFGRSMHGSWN